MPATASDDGGMRLEGKRALVTGAGRRLGAAIAERLAAEGAALAVHYHHSAEPALALCARLEAAGGRAVALGADLSVPGQSAALVGRAVEALGGLDLLVASAANFERVAIDAVDRAHWSRALDLNLGAPFELATAAIAALRRSRGNVVFVTCVSRRSPYRDYLPYQVSKAGLHQLMRVLALELAPEVRVNAVAPGTVLPPEGLSTGELEALRNGIPLGRFGTAAAVADAVLHLATARHITGQELVVDGGHSA
jgi:pteridine reductase